MGTMQSVPGDRQRGYVTAIGYLVLLVLGGLQGLIGSFQYGDSPAPLIAIVLDLLLLATCVLAGWGLRTYSGGILPALGWIVVAFLLAMPRPNGSVVITASAAGEWFLYGGALAAAAGAAASFVTWLRTRPRPRLGGRHRCRPWKGCLEGHARERSAPPRRSAPAPSPARLA